MRLKLSGSLFSSSLLIIFRLFSWISSPASSSIRAGDDKNDNFSFSIRLKTDFHSTKYRLLFPNVPANQPNCRWQTDIPTPGIPSQELHPVSGNRPNWLWTVVQSSACWRGLRTLLPPKFVPVVDGWGILRLLLSYPFGPMP